MKSWGKALLFGTYVWLVPFVVAVLIFPLRASNRPLFESIMPVAVAASAVVFAGRYLRKVDTGFGREGVLLGVLWFAMSVAIDLPLVSAGPMKMSLADYVGDIGVTYLIIPTMTVGMGGLLAAKR